MGCSSSKGLGLEHVVLTKKKDAGGFMTKKLDLKIQERFNVLAQGDKCMAEYIWIGGNFELRCKTKTLDKPVKSVSELPVWNFDGSSTEQAPGTDSEVLLVPCAFYPDPFRKGNGNILVICDCYKPDPEKPKGVGEPIPTNTRVKCAEIMDKVKSTEPWFGICLLYTSPSPRDATLSRMPSSA